MEHKTKKLVLRQTADELNAAVITDLGEWRPQHQSALEKVLFPEFEVSVTTLNKGSENG